MNSACEQSQLDRVKSNSKLYFKFASSISGAQMQGSQIVHLPMLVNPKAAPAAAVHHGVRNFAACQCVNQLSFIIPVYFLA